LAGGEEAIETSRLAYEEGEEGEGGGGIVLNFP
jgi:hypothetical protein